MGRDFYIDLAAWMGRVDHLHIACGREWQLMSQFEPDHHLRVPFQRAAADPDIQGAVGQRVPLSSGGLGGRNPDITDLDMELFFPKAAGRFRIAIGMEVNAIVKRDSRQKALAPGEPNPQKVNIGIADPKLGSSWGLDAFPPIQSDAEEEKRVGMPLLP